MKVQAAQDSIFRSATHGGQGGTPGWTPDGDYNPWFPEPDRSVYYMDDADWQKHHLWDSMHENNEGAFGPWRGPTILNHPDLQYALDNGWRVTGGARAIDYQSRGESGSGSAYLYKISKDGTIHKALLGIGPEDAHAQDMESDERMQPSPYGSVPEKNWRHLIMGEGTTSEGPEMHSSLRDLVDDELFRSADPKHEGYKDFKTLPDVRDVFPTPEEAREWTRKYHHTIRRAWQTGSNQPDLHWNDPIPDPFAGIEDMPRSTKGREPGPRGDFGDSGYTRHPRYGSSDESDEEFWARMEREYPGQQNTSPYLHSPDQAGLSYDEEDPALDSSAEDLDEYPENMSLRDHSRLLRSGVQWDGDLRYPKYTHILHREIVDSDGHRGHGMEGHVIEHNTHNRGPALPTEDYEPGPLEYPWTHTYYPAGLRDEEGLVKGYNTVDGAIHAMHQIGTWGARHSDSQALLHSGYRYVGSEEPYNQNIELPHEAAQRSPR